MPKALKLTKYNVAHIVSNAKFAGFDLSHLDDEIDCNADDGFETYLIVDGKPKLGNITYTCLTDAGFRQSWKFTEGEKANEFADITRV